MAARYTVSLILQLVINFVDPRCQNVSNFLKMTL